MVNVQRDYPKFREAGGEVAVLTMGTSDGVSQFIDRMKLTIPCFADPDRSAYSAYGIGQGSINQVAGPRVWARGAVALLRHGGGMPVGDPLQLSAAFVVDCRGVIRFVHYARNSADLPRHDEMISTIEHCSRLQESE